MGLLLDYTDFDRSIWQSELDDFVPEIVFDAHAHCWDDAYAGTNDDSDSALRHPGGYNELKAHADEIFPHRRNGFLLLGMPVKGMDCRGYQEYMGRQLQLNPLHLANTATVPDMTAEELYGYVRKYRFTGLKPYRIHTADPANCRIRDYLPEPQIEVADELHLAVTLHLSRFDGIADEWNQRDLKELSAKFPNVRWILAHCARAFNSYTLEKSIFFLRELPNVWYDLSAVCDVRSHYLLFKHEQIGRILFGTDNIIAGLDHGKYITWGRGWQFFRATEQPHCDSHCTMVVYEQLRCMRQAAEMAGLDASDVERIFWRNASLLFGFAK